MHCQGLENQDVHQLKVEIPAKDSEKSDLFPAFRAKKHIVFQPHHEFWYEIPAFENAVHLLSQSIEWP